MNNDNQICNRSIFYEKPLETCIDNSMKLTQTSLFSIAIYSILFLLSSICNLTMFSYLCLKNRIKKSRMNKFMFHLNIADLIITFITIPLEVGWKFTGIILFRPSLMNNMHFYNYFYLSILACWKFRMQVFSIFTPYWKLFSFFHYNRIVHR